MRLLLIANPEAYRGTLTDVPMGYAQLARHPAVELFHADTRMMSVGGGEIVASPVPPDFNPKHFHALPDAPTRRYTPDYFDLAFCRTLKPFPESYLDHLATWSPHLAFINNPAGLQRQLRLPFFLNAAEQFSPPSLITADPVEADVFLHQHGTIVAKRGNSCGGRGVYRITPNVTGFEVDNILEGCRQFTEFTTLFDDLTHDGNEPLLLMRYLPRVTEGDKRIVVVAGEIYGVYVRKSTDCHWVQNVTQGAVCELMAPTAADVELVARTCGPYLEVGINILGYDLLRSDDGEWLISEINAGNIGGLFRLQTLGQRGSTDRFVRWLEDYSAWQDHSPSLQQKN